MCIHGILCVYTSVLSCIHETCLLVYTHITCALPLCIHILGGCVLDRRMCIHTLENCTRHIHISTSGVRGHAQSCPWPANARCHTSGGHYSSLSRGRPRLGENYGRRGQEGPEHLGANGDAEKQNGVGGDGHAAGEHDRLDVCAQSNTGPSTLGS